MKKYLSAIWNAYLQYRATVRKNRVVKFARYAGFSLAVVYILILAFPQVLFAHTASHKNFKIYAAQPVDGNLKKVLDQAGDKISKSPLYSPEYSFELYFTDSHTLYAFLANRSYKSFAHSLPALDNIIINKSDPSRDLVFTKRAQYDRRSLSGVVAHEVTHILIRKKFGYFKMLSMPAWKKEGYCEYVAGASTLSDEEGVRAWKANPQDDSGYRYFRYYAMVRYLIEKENLSVEEIFKRDFNEKELAARVFANLQ